MEAQRVAGDRAAVVVEHHGQPRSGRAAVFIDHPQIKWRVIGLPHLIGPTRLTSIQQLVLVRVPFRPIVRQRDQAWVQRLDDAINGGIARPRPATRLGDAAHLTMHRRDGGRRLTQSQPFDELTKIGSQSTPLATVGTSSAGEPSKATPLIALQPALGCAHRYSPIARPALQRDAFFEDWSQPIELLESALSVCFAQRDQRRPIGLGHGVAR